MKVVNVLLGLVLLACAGHGGAADRLLDVPEGEGLRLDLSRELTRFANPNRKPWKARNVALSLPLPGLSSRIGLGVNHSERFGLAVNEWLLTGAHRFNGEWGGEFTLSSAPPGTWRPTWGLVAQAVRRFERPAGSPWPDRGLVGARMDKANNGSSTVLNAGLEWERASWGLELAGKLIRDASGGTGRAYGLKAIWGLGPDWKLDLGHVSSQEFESGRPIRVHAKSLALHWQWHPEHSLSTYATREWRSDTGRSRTMALAWTWQP